MDDTLMVSPGKYIQGAGVIQEAGLHIKQIGNKGLLIADEVVLSIVEASLAQALEAEKIEMKVSRFNGECSYHEIERLRSEAESAQANVVIGAGGGKALDTAKVVGYHMQCPVALITTIAATDAPTSSIAVIYNEDHSHEGVFQVGKNPDLIIADTAIIARAPVRFLVAGMGDALATKFEAEACFRSSGKNMLGYRPPIAALSLARMSYEILIKYGLRAKWSAERGLVSPSLEKVVEANILLSGLGFESGGLAAAHAVQVGFTPSKQAPKTYHGEKVAFGLLVQLFMEDRPDAEIMEIGQFCRSVGLPVILEDLFVEEDEIPGIAAKANSSAIMKNMPYPVTPQLVADCILLADSFGRELARVRQ